MLLKTRWESRKVSRLWVSFNTLGITCLIATFMFSNYVHARSGAFVKAIDVVGTNVGLGTIDSDKPGAVITHQIAEALTMAGSGLSTKLTESILTKKGEDTSVLDTRREWIKNFETVLDDVDEEYPPKFIYLNIKNVVENPQTESVGTDGILGMLTFTFRALSFALIVEHVAFLYVTLLVAGICLDSILRLVRIYKEKKSQIRWLL